MSYSELYFAKIAAAFVRGKLADKLPERFRIALLDELSENDLDEIIQIGLDAGLRLHRFKRTMGLARVQRVLGALKGLAPVELLDIGSGRGAFLWPLADAFPALPITAIDMDQKRVDDVNAVRDGGIGNLQAKRMSAVALDFEDDSFDVVTMLEVLEHIPEARKAVKEAARAAKRFVVISVPTKEDDNPEHIHLFNQKILTEMLQEAGALKTSFDYVLNHVIAVAKVGD